MRNIYLCLFFLGLFLGLRNSVIAASHTPSIVLNKEIEGVKKASLPSQKKLQKARKFFQSRFGQWVLRKLEKKMARKKVRREKRIAQGKKVPPQGQDVDFGWLGLVLLIGGLAFIAIGLLLLLLSLGNASFVLFMILGGLATVSGLVFLFLWAFEA